MTELRQDPLTGAVVLIAEDRGRRPHEFERRSVRKPNLECPFCRGNEAATPTALATYPPPARPGDNSKDWLVRVIPNRYPAVTPLPAGAAAARRVGPDPTTCEEIGGAHELFVEAPDHVASLTELSPAGRRLVFHAYRDRIAALRDRGNVTYSLIFKNAGEAAGASIEHIHSQLVGLPFTPPVVQHEIIANERYFEQHGRAAGPAIAAQEIACGERVVVRSDSFAAYCPFASRFPFEQRIAPLAPPARFEDLSDQSLADLAEFVGRAIGRLEIAIDHPDYNYYLHTAPFDTSADEHYYWHIEVFPRIAKIAGFEWGSGCFLNSVAPERAASILRNAQSDEVV